MCLVCEAPTTCQFPQGHIEGNKKKRRRSSRAQRQENVSYVESSGSDTEMGSEESVVKPKDVLNKVFEELGLNSDVLVHLSALVISKASMEAGGRSHRRAKLIMKMISNRVAELLCPENPHWNVTDQNSILRPESKKLDAINDSMLNLLVTGNRNTELIVRSVMSHAYKLSYLESISESKIESYESSLDMSLAAVASRRLKF